MFLFVQIGTRHCQKHTLSRSKTSFNNAFRRHLAPGRALLKFWTSPSSREELRTISPKTLSARNSLTRFCIIRTYWRRIARLGRIAHSNMSRRRPMPQIKTQRTCYSTRLKALAMRVVRRTSSPLKWTNLSLACLSMEAKRTIRLSWSLMVSTLAPSRSMRSRRNRPKKNNSSNKCAPKQRAIGTTLSRTWSRTLVLMCSVKGTKLYFSTVNKLSSQRM